MLGESQPLTQKAKVEYTVGEAVTALGTGITMLFAGGAGIAAKAGEASGTAEALSNAENAAKDANQAERAVKNVNGALRARKFGENWTAASLNKAVEKFAPDALPVNTESGKTIYTNDRTGIQVVYDKSGNYFRIEDTTKPRGRNYLNANGVDMNNKVIDGKQMGRSKSEYQSVTHFKNSDR